MTVVVVRSSPVLPPNPNILKIKLIIRFGMLSIPLKKLLIHVSIPFMMEPIGVLPDP